MDHQLSARAARRAEMRQRPPRQRGRRRGQSLVIFALSITVLLGLAGLVIDIVRAYDLYAREQRAAEAAALAGVIYMPSFYNSPITVDNNSAISRALLEAQKNGFGVGVTPPASCTGVNTSAAVAVCRTTLTNTALQVTLTQHIDVFLMSTIGIQGFDVSATATADFLQPYVLGASPVPGSGGNCWGDCSATGQAKNYLASINGPGEFKEMGDPFVYCEDGSSNGPPADGNLNDPLLTVPLLNTQSLTAAGFNTNHLPYATGSQCGTGASGNPDQQPAGFVGPATGPGTTYPGHPGAYNYAIQASPGDTLWIKNPGFSPHDAQSSCNGSQVWDDFFQDTQCTNYYTKFGPITWDKTHFDDPRMYFTVTYSLYQVQDVFFRNTDTFISTSAWAPLDLKSADLALHCGGQGAYDLSQVSSFTSATTGVPVPNGVIGSCIPTASSNFYADQWRQVGTFPAPAGGGAGPFLYRMAVEASPYIPNNNNAACANVWMCGFGRHAYDIEVCSNNTNPPAGTCTSNAQISGWNNMDTYLNFPSANKNIYVPIAYVPASYAGRIINISFFDPGDSHGSGDNSYFAVVPPDSCINVVYPTVSPTWLRVVSPYPGTISPVPTGTCAVNVPSVYSAQKNQGGQVPSDDIYNGLWITSQMQLPSTFKGGQFWLNEFSATGKNFDEMAVKFQLAGGSPVHLVG